MSGITVYNSSNTPQSFMGRWQSSDYPAQDGLAIRQNNRMVPLDNFAFGSYSYGPVNWSTANMNSTGWSAWRDRAWFSNIHTIESDRYIMYMELGLAYDANTNVIPGFNASCQIQVALGTVSETVPYGIIINEYLTTDSLNGFSGNEVQNMSRIFTPLDTPGGSNMSMHQQFKVSYRTRIQRNSSMWFRGFKLRMEPI